MRKILKVALIVMAARSFVQASAVDPETVVHKAKRQKTTPVQTVQPPATPTQNPSSPAWAGGGSIVDVLRNDGPPTETFGGDVIKNIGSAADVLDQVVLQNTIAPLVNTVTRADSSTTLRAVLANALSRSSPVDVALLGGVQTLRVRNNNWTAPAVGLRAGSETSPWSYEFGALLPTDVPGNFRTTEQRIANLDSIARVKTMYEMHLVADYAFRPKDAAIVPEVGFGVSMMYIKNNINVMTTYTYQSMGTTYTYDVTQGYTDINYAFSPLFRLGVSFFPNRLISGRVDVSYVGYGNAVNAAGQTFDLGFAGWTVREVVQIRL
jgi:hypothetical protein